MPFVILPQPAPSDLMLTTIHDLKIFASCPLLIERIILPPLSYSKSMNTLKNYTIKGIIFVLITGTISHFIYEWSGNNPILGFFFPVNESVWEHMKLCFFPTLLYSFYMNRQLESDYPCVTSSLLFGILFGTILIPVIFYTYSGILGYHSMVLDIATFIVSVLLTFLAVYKLTLSCAVADYQDILKILVLIFTVCFFAFTYYPPDIGITNTFY